MRPIDRREFLRGSALALLGVAAACGGDGGSPRPAGGRTLAELTAGRAQNLGVLLGVTETLARPSERMPVILHEPGDPSKLVRSGSGRLWIAETRTSRVLGPFEVAYHDEGLRGADEGTKGLYSARVSIPRDGSWLGLVEVTPQGSSSPLLGGAQFGVGRRTQQPVPGDEAVSTPTPTPADHRGVEPYCTRRPPCAMHEISLDRALANGKPTVLIIATPAFCSSRTCGPEVDVVQAVSLEMGPKANFVHIEVYRDDEEAPAKGILSPAARAWRLEEEPVIYFIGSSGAIIDRFVGPAATDEVRSAATALG